MESNQLKTLKIDWLGHCPTCEREQHSVATSEGNKDYLYEDDTVKCWCGQTGVIETDGQGHAWCNWDEKAVSEWDKFNIYYRQKYPEYWGLLPKANHQACSHHEELFNSWVTAKSQAVPEGFVLVPKAGAQYFSHDFNGDGFKYHDTLDEAKKEAEVNLDWYRDQVADGRHVNDMGEFYELSYGLVIGSAEYSIDHVVTQDEIDKGESKYEVGTEILSLYLSEAQEQSHE